MTFELAVDRLRSIAAAAEHLPATLPNGVPNLEAARIRITEGIPALAGEPLLDAPMLLANMQFLGADIESVAQLELPALCDAALAGSWDAVPNVRARAALIVFLDHAVRPALRAGFSAAREVIAAAPWTRGTCPACGALPLLAELHPDKDGNTRVLRCGRCTAAWAFTRLECPACGTRDHNDTRYVHVDGKADYRRAECCTRCGFYVKAVATLAALDAAALLERDLDTLALDALALAAGYSREPVRERMS